MVQNFTWDPMKKDIPMTRRYQSWGVCQRTYLDLSYQPFWRVGHVVVLDLSYYFSLSGPTLNLSYSQLTACRTIPIRGHVLRFR